MITNPAIYNRRIRELENENQELRHKLHWSGYMQSEEVQKHIEKLQAEIVTIRADLKRAQDLNELMKVQVAMYDSFCREKAAEFYPQAREM